MTAEKITSKALMASVVVGLALIVAGELMNVLGGNDGLLRFGILFLILSPLFAVAAATASLAAGREWKWVVAAIILILVSAIGMLVASM